MKQHYQTIDAAATALGRVTVAIGEVIADVWDSLLAMAVGTGLQVTAATMAEDLTGVCRPKASTILNRTAGEGLAETLTVLRLAVPPTDRRRPCRCPAPASPLAPPEPELIHPYRRSSPAPAPAAVRRRLPKPCARLGPHQRCGMTPHTRIFRRAGISGQQ